jgi:2-dehydro-3-deoxyphosphogluconate aldolase/(4S)-4-hydroxy-2-oxoglutarate aldolase
MNNTFSWDAFNEAPIVGIVRGLPFDVVVNIAKSYLDSGLSTIEITMNTPNAANIITTLTKQFPNLNVGAGTVCNIEDLQKALSAGSQFIVTPIIDEDVIKTCVGKDIPIFPGGYSPTEIYRAFQLGASAVKVFPATQLGPQYIKDILAPLNHLKLLPTGGVTVDNIKSFFEAGSTGVGMGSSLLDKKLIKNKDYKGLAEHFRMIKNKII